MIERHGEWGGHDLAKSRVEAFAAALQHFEQTGDSTELCGQFAEGTGLVRPEVTTSGKGTSVGTPDVSRF